MGRWFDVRHRGLDAWAFALNRLTGVVLVLYLFVHLVVLSLLARGPDAWDDFLSLVRRWRSGWRPSWWPCCSSTLSTGCG